MPEFPFVQAGVSRTVGNVPATSQGTTITSGGATNTKGSYVEITAATTFDANWLLINFGNFTTGTVSHLVDIAIGAATEQIIIPDLFTISRGANGSAAPYLFPIFIPAGSRIAARNQAATATQSLDIVLTLFSGTHLSSGSGPSMVSAYGSTTGSLGTNIDPGGTANTDSAWTEIATATDRSHNWLVVSGRFGDASIGAGGVRYLVDIGIGAATEQEIVSDLFFGSDNVADLALNPVLCFPYFIPAGSRLAARVRSTSTVDADRDIWINLYGAG